MGEITLSNEEMQKIRIASDVTKVDVVDCVETEDKIIFVLKKGFIIFALGRNARNVDTLRKFFKKNVRFVELDDDEEKFIVNLFKPFKIESITIEKVGKRNVAKVEVNSRDKSKVIGKNGRNINAIRELAKRHSSVDDVQIL
ncbi:MAG: NusA-like transcription termination signal-binding factor [Thermoplasmata archaeon]|nr:MAG: NusA-like transcription termination signal-binding factor [Thermoplasmata archaeon]RLF45766.1 MAG: NusA-like transcription termination signal-binding factor [Thermoplasmata archaeon]